jgi:ubiquinol-cytochrome c reductase cytochrome b subunit
MKKQLLAVVFALVPLLLAPLSASASEEGGWPLDHVKFDPSNKASLQQGAQLFMNYCMGCHSLQYERYNRLVTGLGIPEDLVMQNLRFDSSAKIGDLMVNSMATKQAKEWFGAPPPDLTLETRARGAAWVYTYLRTFYRDPARPWGVNNKVFPDVGMPHALLSLQGLQECAPGPALAENGGILRDPLTGKEVLIGEDGKPLHPCGRLKVVEPGKLTPAEYDHAVYDLVNFLNYMAEPMQQARKHTGVYVLFFLAIFFVFAWLLNREYWKDVHH